LVVTPSIHIPGKIGAWCPLPGVDIFTFVSQGDLRFWTMHFSV
jgi:hypothetical protein